MMLKGIQTVLALAILSASAQSFAVTCKCKSTNKDAPYMDAACKETEYKTNSAIACEKLQNNLYTHKYRSFFPRGGHCSVERLGENVSCEEVK